MSALTDLASAISTQLQIVVAVNTVVDLTNQRDADGTVDTAVLTGVSNQAARKVQRKLGRTVDNTDDDAVDFGVRYALLDLVTFWSATLTDSGLAYMAGVDRDITEEATARRQANSVQQLGLEDFLDEDLRWPKDTWDESVSGDY